jgi:p-cymene methyl-monooxygenase
MIGDRDMDYLRYYFSVLFPLVAALGFLIGGDAVWFGVVTFPVMALIDSVLPNDMAPRKIGNKALAEIPVWMCALGTPALYLVAAYWVSQSSAITGWQFAGAALSLGWLSVIPLVPATHELYHQRSNLKRFFGRYMQICYLDCSREIAHVVGHHINVATTEDFDTAKRGTNLYSFTGKAIIQSTIDSLTTESNALEKEGYGRWGIRHRIWKAILAQIIVQTIIFLIGGWMANAVALTGMLVARFWVESFNYFQHYGLIRLPGAPIARRHVWNHLKPFSRILGFEITNHADHHTNSFASYYELVPDRLWIPMPSVFLCFFTALIPPLWHNVIIMPALKRWDNEMATPAEREIARQQNREAGWPDWFGEEQGRFAAVA